MSLTRIAAVVILTMLCASPAFAELLRDQYTVDANSGLPATPVRVPEGVAFDPLRAEFYATSVFGGRISAIDGRSGVERTFYQESNPSTAFAGIKIAPLLRVAWVCAIDSASLTTLPTSWLYAVRIEGDGHGELLRRIDLPAPFFCNDLALDLVGNVYVTNSLGDEVIRVRPSAPWDASERAQIFARSALLAPGAVGPNGLPVGMNGIAVTPDQRSLLVVRGLPARILRISLNAPSQVSVVTLRGDVFGVLPFGALNPDGIVFVRGRLYVVFAAGVQELTFGDDKPGRGLRLPNYDTATVRSTGAVPFGLSTAAEAFSHLYVIDSEIHALSGNVSLPIELPHRLVRVPLEAFGK